MFTKEVRVFRKAMVFFSAGGEYYQDDPVVYHYMRDALIEYSRPVMINIPYKVGKQVKIELYFDAKWIMISEVRFESGKGAISLVFIELIGWFECIAVYDWLKSKVKSWGFYTLPIN